MFFRQKRFGRCSKIKNKSRKGADSISPFVTNKEVTILKQRENYTFFPILHKIGKTSVQILDFVLKYKDSESVKIF